NSISQSIEPESSSTRSRFGSTLFATDSGMFARLAFAALVKLRPATATATARRDNSGWMVLLVIGMAALMAALLMERASRSAAIGRLQNHGILGIIDVAEGHGAEADGGDAVHGGIGLHAARLQVTTRFGNRRQRFDDVARRLTDLPAIVGDQRHADHAAVPCRARRHQRRCRLVDVVIPAGGGVVVGQG